MRPGCASLSRRTNVHLHNLCFVRRHPNVEEDQLGWRLEGCDRGVPGELTLRHCDDALVVSARLDVLWGQMRRRGRGLLRCKRRLSEDSLANALDEYAK